MTKKTNRRKFIEKPLVSIAGVSTVTSCVSASEEKVKESRGINIFFLLILYLHTKLII